MNLLQTLLATLRARQHECETIERRTADEYLRGMMHGYAGAYELSAQLVENAILQQQVIDWENLIAEMYGKEVQA